jgi:hypothetical protein
MGVGRWQTVIKPDLNIFDSELLQHFYVIHKFVQSLIMKEIHNLTAGAMTPVSEQLERRSRIHIFTAAQCANCISLALHTLESIPSTL